MIGLDNRKEGLGKEGSMNDRMLAMSCSVIMVVSFSLSIVAILPDMKKQELSFNAVEGN